MRTMQPNEPDLQALMQHDATTPVVMINLLKFKATTADGETGEAVYNRYARNAAALVAEVGGRLLWQGRADHLIVGGPEDRWDRVLLVEYPSRAAFALMLQLPEFATVQGDRQAALEETVLIAATTERSLLHDT